MADEMKCIDCGTFENVESGPCPYQQDVNNRIEIVNLCDECYSRRIQEI